LRERAGVRVRMRMKGNKLLSKARRLRRHQTDAERLLWSHLRARRLEGLKFRRQHPIGRYIVDFVCLEKAVIIEVDGGQHAYNQRDRERDEFLQRAGFRVLRFWNHEVFTNLWGVLEVIRKVCLEDPSPHPSPRRGEGHPFSVGEGH